MKNRLLIIVVSILFSTMAAAVPAKPGPIEIEQPDGTKLTIVLVGDEWYHFTKTTDGYEIRQNRRQIYYYVTQNRKGKKRTSCRRAKNPDNRSRCETRWLEKHGVKRQSTFN